MTRKFLFDTSFDEAAVVIAAPQAPEPTVSLDELDAVRRQAFAEGLEQGRMEVATGLEAQQTAAIERLVAQAGAALGAADVAAAAAAAGAINLAVAVVRKLMPALVARDGTAEIEAMLASVLSGAIEEPRIVVRVADANLDPLADRIDRLAQRAGFPGRVILLADPGVAADGCRVEWADGGAERDPDRLWSEVDQAVANLALPKSA